MRSILDPLPLRDSTVWDAFRTVEWLPQRYGPCGGRCVQYDETRRVWVWNDRASAGVDKVLVRDLPVSNWEWRNGVDKTGRGVTFVLFSEPVEEGAEVIARGRGAIHAETGALLENAADVLYDVLVLLGGLPFAAARFDALRGAAADLPVGGSIDTNASARDVAVALCGSIGAVFSPDMPDLARVYPGIVGEPRAAVRDGAGFVVRVGVARDDVVNDLTLRYAIEAGKPRGAVQYDVPTSVERVGRAALVLDAPWVTSSRVAATVVERRLAQSSRPRWRLQVSDIPGELLVGDAVALDCSLLPGVVGVHLVESADYDDTADTTAIEFYAPAEPVPELRFIDATEASSAIEPIVVTPTAGNDEYGFYVKDEAGRVVPSAVCVLDGSITRHADASGWVSFPAHALAPGMHTVVASFDGRSVTITLNI